MWTISNELEFMQQQRLFSYRLSPNEHTFNICQMEAIFPLEYFMI